MAEPTQGPRFYGRRHGRRLRPKRQLLLQGLLPRIAIARPKEGAGIDPRALFASPVDEVWLEIGFGGGEHLAAQAAAHPTVGMIGCEVYVDGVATLLGHVDRDALANLRIFADDARLLLPALPDASIARVFVLFPDPWPKSRHAERRFIGPDNLDQLSRLMTDGAELRIATDDETYKGWALDQMAARADFARLAADPALRPPDWPVTRYEEKAVKAGRTPIFLAYRRQAR